MLVAVLAAALAAPGCGETSGAQSTLNLKTLGMRVAPGSTPLAVGDVDGDGTADIAFGGPETGRDWLLTSRGGAHVTRLVHSRLGPFGQSGHEISSLGDADGDGMDDIAIASDRRSLAILYGRRQWPARTDLRAAGDAHSAAVIGTGSTRPGDAVARRGATLIAAPDCLRCPAGQGRVLKIKLPKRGARVAVSGRTVRGVRAPQGRVLSIPAAPWASGPQPVTAWKTTVRGSENLVYTPLVAASGRTPRLLGGNDVLLGTTPSAALAETQPETPNGEAQISRLRLYGLGPSGPRVDLTPEAGLDARGMIATAGSRCILVAGWGNTTPAVWLLDAATLAERDSWQPAGASAAGASAAGSSISIVTLDGGGRISLAREPLPELCR
ncbi:MAG: hypothetical protein QOJ35_3421 [Solirubrobacteraceae bacterium]|jgi:hypothetical protein|nr:hypothetical protein [Solirubrobacteraceae bacterium]